MSRTYRCRHLPAARGWDGVRISRVSDGARGFSYRRVRDAAEAQVKAEFGPEPARTRMVHVRGASHKVWHRAVYKTVVVFGKPCRWLVKPDWHEVFPGRRMRTWENWAWDQEVERVLRGTSLPISAWHPLQRRGPAGSAKKFERVTANRRMRHVTRQVLSTSDLDDDWDGHMPSRNTYFDWRSIY